jgi:Na+-driven multidrug efflux pump
MNNQTNWRYIFQLKAVINWVESVFLLLSDQWIRELVGEKPLINSEYSHLFLVLVFVIGIGYWWVGNDISRNHGIVKLGILAQCSVFLVLAYHTLINNLHPFYLLPGIIDLTFAIIFGIFLNSYVRTQPVME